MDIASFKKSFFDVKAVADKIDPAVKRALSKIGAYTRRRDKSSLKYLDGPAAKGKPPHVHRRKRFTRKKTTKGVASQQAASPLRELIFFGYDDATKSVVIGPATYSSKQGPAGSLPAKIEEQHPHLGPAFAIERTRAADEFKGLIR